MDFIVKLLVLFCLLLTLVCGERHLSVPKSIKGIKGGTVTLICIPPKATIAHPTISWEKKNNGESESIASSVYGLPHFSSPKFESRASLNGGNLTISLLEIADGGRYTCKVTPVQSDILSSDVDLVVTARPRVFASANVNPKIDSNNTYVAAVCVAASGQPRPNLRWTNHAGELTKTNSPFVCVEQKHQRQVSEESLTELVDGTWSVRSKLILRPGLLRKASNSSHPLKALKKVEEFVCHVDHEDLIGVEQNTKKVKIEVLYAPFAFISILGNRLTCHANGNPYPSTEWVLPSGVVLPETASVFLEQKYAGDGLYTCRAFSPLKPDSVATLDVQKARDLPILFRTIVKLNTSLPTTASGYTITCSADVIKSVNTKLEFEWTRNGKKLANKTYQIMSQIRPMAGAPNSQLLSTLRFLDVKQDRDDAEFQCKLVNRSLVDGFVSAVERSVMVSVDYAPTEVKVVGFPVDFTAKEKETLTLRCSAESKPASIKEWYFKGLKIHTGDLLRFTEIRRSESGVYRCLAHNYVPGSSYGEVKVTVVYPPSGLVIREIDGERLSCEASGGSFPPPLYSWIYPNHTILRRNTTVIKLLDAPDSLKYVYTCLVTNNLGVVLNTTYDQLPVDIAKIGDLSVTEFSATLVGGCVFLFVLLLVGYLIHRRKVFEQKSAEDTGSCEDEKSAFSKRKLNCYNCAAENPALECTPIAAPSQALVGSLRDLNTPQSSSTKQFVDGSSIEITAVESLPSSTNPSTEQFSTTKSDEAKTFLESKSSTTKTENQTYRVEKGDSWKGYLPVSIRLANIRRDVARQMQKQNFASIQYISKNTIPRSFMPRMPINASPPRQVGVVVSGYNPILYDATSHPKSAISWPETGCAQTALPDSLDVQGCASVVTKDFVDNLRPRSLSLSASSSTKSFSPLQVTATSGVNDCDQEVSTFKTLDLESCNLARVFSSKDCSTAKMLVAKSVGKKHHSLTLV